MINLVMLRLSKAVVATVAVMVTLVTSLVMYSVISLAVVAAVEIGHLAKEDGMITAFVFKARAAPEAGGIAFDEGRAFGPIAPVEAVELVVAGTGKAVGHGLLVFGEDMDSPTLRIAEHRQGSRLEG